MPSRILDLTLILFITIYMALSGAYVVGKVIEVETTKAQSSEKTVPK